MPKLASRIIAIISGSVEVGTTLITARLGMALAKMNHCVVEMDTDVGDASLGAYLGVQSRCDADLVAVFDGRCSVRQALVRIERQYELYVLCLAQNTPVDVVKTIDLVRVCNQLRGECGFILIDSGANEATLDMMLTLADEFILVTVPEVEVSPAVKRTALRLGAKRKPCWLIVNRLKLELMKRGQVCNPYQLSDMLHIPLVGIIKEIKAKQGCDSEVNVNNEQQLYTKSIDDITRRLMGEQVPFDKCYGSKGSLWRRLASK